MFFFFKQKTAYEMRISDWSSDVCSSDLLGTVGTHAINQSVYKEMSFDAVKDFAPISLVAAVPNILVANPSLEANSVQEPIALAKQKPGEITFASSGNGSSIHLSGEMFKSLAGVDMLHVPYKGSGPAARSDERRVGKEWVR